MTNSKASMKSKAAPQLKDSKQQKSKNGSICPPAVKKGVSTESKSIAPDLAMGMKSGVQNSPDAFRQRIQSNSATGAIRDLRITIALLFMLNHCPQLPPSKHTCPCVDDRDNCVKEHLLSLSDEESLTGAFCFLASTMKDPYKVAALCLEQSVESGFITLRIAANRGDLSRVVAGLRTVLAAMKAAEQEARQNRIDRMLEAVVSMNQNRIFCRTRSSYAKWDCNYAKSKSSKPALLPQLVEKLRNSLSNDHMEPFRENILQLQRLTETLEKMGSDDARSHHGVALLIQVLKIIYRLRYSTCFQDGHVTDIPPIVRKLAHYVSVSRYLLEQVRLKRMLSTMTIQIVRFEPIASEDFIPSPQDLRSLFTLQDSTTSALQVLDRLVLSGKQDQANTKDVIVCKRVGELMRNKWPVHAEMQLLFYYQLNSNAVPPLVIYSTKKPCFLCSLFFSLHGKFDIPSTHGRMYEKWTLPAEVANLTGSAAKSFSVLMTAFKAALVDCIVSSVVSSSKRGPGPATSSESFYLDLPSQTSPFSVRQVIDEATAIASATSTNHDQSEIPMSDTEEQSPAHGDGEIDRFLDKDSTVTFHVSESTRETRLATEVLRLYFNFDEAESQLSPPKSATWSWTVSVTVPKKDSARYSLDRSRAGQGSLVFDASALLPGREETLVYDDHGEGEAGFTFTVLSAQEILVVNCRRKMQSQPPSVAPIQ